jgi:CBS domain-containing protein
MIVLSGWGDEHMQIEQCMKTDVVSISLGVTVRQAASLLVEKHISTLPVTEDDGQLVGLLTIADVIYLFMPDFVALLDQINFLPDFGVLEERALPADTAELMVQDVMREPICVTRGSGLLRAFARLRRHHLLDLPVVDERGVLIGIASRVDIGTAFLTHWLKDRSLDSAAGAT